MLGQEVVCWFFSFPERPDFPFHEELAFYFPCKDAVLSSYTYPAK